MRKELSSFEKMGGTYIEVDGILYPNIEFDKEESLDIGKYGSMWIRYMKENHTDRYRHLMRMGNLQRKAYEVNEETYEMLEQITNKYLVKHKPTDSHSTMEMLKLRERAKQIAEEWNQEYADYLLAMGLQRRWRISANEE